MTKLNDKDEHTEKIIHLMVTSMCDRNCEHCCNKQYDLNSIPYATSEELFKADTVYITGGEPFEYSNPCIIARYLKTEFNIPRVIVYTNACELADYLSDGLKLFYIDGLTVSIKNNFDLVSFENEIVHNEEVEQLQSNMLYVFEDLYPEDSGNFIVRERKWQEKFVPNPNSIFRKL